MGCASIFQNLFRNMDFYWLLNFQLGTTQVEKSCTKIRHFFENALNTSFLNNITKRWTISILITNIIRSYLKPSSKSGNLKKSWLLFYFCKHVVWLLDIVRYLRTGWRLNIRKVFQKYPNCGRFPKWQNSKFSYRKISFHFWPLIT